MTFAVFKDGKQVSKAHSTIIAARIEAYEVGAVIGWSADFGPLGFWKELARGYTVEEIKDDS